MSDGRKGQIGDDDDSTYEGGSNWSVTVTFDDESEDDENEIHVRPDEKIDGLWVEIG